MVANRELRYWEEKKHEGMDSFSMKEYTEKPCWKTARELDEFRCLFNICEDCIVFYIEKCPLCFV